MVCMALGLLSARGWRRDAFSSGKFLGIWNGRESAHERHRGRVDREDRETEGQREGKEK